MVGEEREGGEDGRLVASVLASGSGRESGELADQSSGGLQGEKDRRGEGGVSDVRRRRAEIGERNSSWGSATLCATRKGEREKEGCGLTQSPPVWSKKVETWAV